MRISVTVNGKLYQSDNRVEGESLLYVLRERWGFTSVKNACEEGECGACAVLVDGVLVNSCLVLAAQADGADVVTVEGICDSAGTSPLHPVQRALLAEGAVQCGFCIPGMVMAACDLLRRCPQPSEGVIRSEMAGNLCRCTGYQKIIEGVLRAARQAAQEQRT
jgi:aerobic carbon-monoxide dehydrogenase small subunit